MLEIRSAMSEMPTQRLGEVFRIAIAAVELAMLAPLLALIMAGNIQSSGDPSGRFSSAFV